MKYTVKAGDTLSQIARDHDLSLAAIMRLNPDITDPNQIQTGQSLLLAEGDSSRKYCSVGQVLQDSECKPAEFDIAFYWNDKAQTRNAIYTEIYGPQLHFAHQSIFARNNDHLGETVLPGEIVIISNLPRTPEDKEVLGLLKDQARQASEGLQQLGVEEATAIKRHILTLDYVSVENLANTQSAALGVLSAVAGHQVNEVKEILEKLDAAYINELASNKPHFSSSFYTERQRLFAQLDNVAARLITSRLNVRQYNKVKHTLGLSTKSILHNANEILSTGQVPQLGRRIKEISAMAKGAKRLGYIGIGIDLGVRGSRVYDACFAGDDKSCERVAFRQAGGFIGTGLAGGMGGFAGAKVAVSVVGGVAILFGVTVGAPVLIVAGLAGAAAGAYYGGTVGGAQGEWAGDTLFKWIGGEQDG